MADVKSNGEEISITNSPVQLVGKKIVKIQTEVPMCLEQRPDGTVALRPVQPNAMTSQTIRLNEANTANSNGNPNTSIVGTASAGVARNASAQLSIGGPNKLAQFLKPFGAPTTHRKLFMNDSFPTRTNVLNNGYLGYEEMVSPFGKRRHNNNASPNQAKSGVDTPEGITINVIRVASQLPSRLCPIYESENIPKKPMAVRTGARAHLPAMPNVRFMPYNTKVVEAKVAKRNDEPQVANTPANPTDSFKKPTNVTVLGGNTRNALTDVTNVKMDPPAPPQGPTKKEPKKRGRKPKAVAANGEEPKPKRVYRKKPKIPFPYLPDPNYDDAFPDEICDILFADSPIPDEIYEKYFSLKAEPDDDNGSADSKGSSDSNGPAGDGDGDGGGDGDANSQGDGRANCSSNDKADGGANDKADGGSNGQADGGANGQADGSSNGQADGSSSDQSGGSANASGDDNGSSNNGAESNPNANGSGGDDPNGNGNPNGNPNGIVGNGGDATQINIEKLTEELRKVISFQFPERDDKALIKPKGFYGIVGAKGCISKAEAFKLRRERFKKLLALRSKIRTMFDDTPIDCGALERYVKEYTILKRPPLIAIKGKSFLKKILKKDTLYAKFVVAETNKATIRRIKKSENLVFYMNPPKGGPTCRSNISTSTEVKELYLGDGKDAKTGRQRVMRIKHLLHSDGWNKLQRVRILHVLPGEMTNDSTVLGDNLNQLQRNIENLEVNHFVKKKEAEYFRYRYRKEVFTRGLYVNSMKALHTSAMKRCQKIEALLRVLWNNEQNYMSQAWYMQYALKPIKFTMTIEMKDLCRVVLTNLDKGPTNHYSFRRTIHVLKRPAVAELFKKLLDGLLPESVPSHKVTRKRLGALAFGKLHKSLRSHERQQALNDLTHQFVHKRCPPGRFLHSFEKLTDTVLPRNCELLIKVHSGLMSNILKMTLCKGEDHANVLVMNPERPIRINNQQLEDKLEADVITMIKKYCECFMRKMLKRLCKASRESNRLAGNKRIEKAKSGQNMEQTTIENCEQNVGTLEQTTQADSDTQIGVVKEKIIGSEPTVTRVTMRHLYDLLYQNRKCRPYDPSLLLYGWRDSKRSNRHRREKSQMRHRS